MFGYPDQFIPHGTKNELQSIYRLDAESIVNDVIKIVNKSRV
jgi:1-deoxy-D-xylulose-5-phosphate synthase